MVLGQVILTLPKFDTEGGVANNLTSEDATRCGRRRRENNMFRWRLEISSALPFLYVGVVCVIRFARATGALDHLMSLPSKRVDFCTVESEAYSTVYFAMATYCTYII